MTLPKLTIIPAGAGSGKTYKLQKQLFEWIKENRVSADRIVAVTFTEAAAAELRSRIRTELVDNGRLQDALKLDQSYISTIHGFGLRIMTEFAFEAGVSPQPRMLNEDEEATFIRLNLSSTDKSDAIAKNLKHFGYQYDHNSGDSGEDIFRDKVLGLINTLRSIGRSEEDKSLFSPATEHVKEIYGQTVSATLLQHILLDAINNLLEQFPQSLSSTLPSLNPTAADQFRKNYACLKRANSSDALNTDWNLWQQLRSLRRSKRGSATPEGYDDLADQVIDAASELPNHPGPLHDALVHVEALLGTSQDILQKYADQKLQKGLVDYTDMLAIARNLFTSNPKVLQELRNRIDCLVIDEFQDTNPLQFSLLWALFEAGVPTLIVGDLKQAIMRFQNADSRLMSSLQKKYKDHVSPLTSNWRSSRELMAAVNLFGSGLYGDDYEKLTPMADFISHMKPLDGVLLEKGCGKSDSQKARHMAMHIHHLLESGSHRVWDKRLKKHRLLKGSDIAVLCYTHNHLSHYANALNALGLRTRLAGDGWFESRPVQLLYYALSYVADPEDLHAALYLTVTELNSGNLEEALKALVRGHGLDNPILEKLRIQCDIVRELELVNAVDLVVQTLSLHTLVAHWPDADQARADLLRFQGEVEEFSLSNREAMASGGYYNHDIKTLLAWLKAKVDKPKKNKLPDARFMDENAIELVTWHASKGREWPVVAICRMDKKWDPRLPGNEVIYKDFNDLSKILDSALVEFYPKFASPETNEKFLEQLLPDAEQDALNILYVVLTRAREKLILECPTIQNIDILSYWNLLREKTGMIISGASKLEILNEPFSWSTKLANFTLDDDFTEIEDNLPQLPCFGRRAIIRQSLPENLAPESKAPSSMHGLKSVKNESWQQDQYAPL